MSGDAAPKRLLVTSYPLLGHLNPVLPLALAATGPDLSAAVARHGPTGWPVGPTHAESVAGPGPWFVSSAGPRARDLVPRAREWRPDLVVADEVEAAGPVAAAACGAALLLPRCDLVVSQGGAGILLGGFAHARPQLLLPQGADQFVNAGVATAAGAAPTLTPDELTPAAVTAAVARLLDEPAFAVPAARIGAEIAAMPDADEVVGVLAARTPRRAVRG